MQIVRSGSDMFKPSMQSLFSLVIRYTAAAKWVHKLSVLSAGCVAKQATGQMEGAALLSNSKTTFK